MSARGACLWIWLALLAGAGVRGEDCFLEREDAFYREAEGLEAKAKVLQKLMVRRLSSLECRFVASRKEECARLLSKDSLVAELESRSDQRLLEDYHGALRTLLLTLEDAYAHHLGRTTEIVLYDLEKQGKRHLASLESLQPLVTGQPELMAAQPDLARWLERCLELTRKAVGGARKGLDKLRDRKEQ